MLNQYFLSLCERVLTSVGFTLADLLCMDEPERIRVSLEEAAAEPLGDSFSPTAQVLAFDASAMTAGSSEPWCTLGDFGVTGQYHTTTAAVHQSHAVSPSLANRDEETYQQCRARIAQALAAGLIH